MRLAELQQAFQDRVLHGSSTIETVVPGTERFDTATRLSIYEFAYIKRLIDAVATTYPALQRAMGERKFAKLIQAYAAKTPPSHFSIRYFGRDLNAFIDANFSGIKTKGLSELARWEWTLATAFDAQDSDALTREALASIAPEQWPQVCFRVSPSFHRTCMRTNAVQWWREPSDNERAPTRWRMTKPVEWLIWRSQLTTFYRSLKNDEACAIDVVASGQSFATLCEQLVQFSDETQAPARAATLLHQWLNDGWLSGIILADA